MTRLARKSGRHEPGPAPGRPLRTHAPIDTCEGAESAGLNRLTSTATNAATSDAVGTPRTTLTSGSSSIDRAYDEPRPDGDTRPTPA